MDVLVRIKRLVFQGRVRYTEKAIDEMATDGLVPSDAEESILNAQIIEKTMQSRSRTRRSSKEKLYVIKSFNYTGRRNDSYGGPATQGATGRAVKP